MEACISDMIQWLLSNNLQLNTAKTEILLFGTRQQLTKVSQPATASIGDSAINTTTMAHNLGVKSDNRMSFDQLVDVVCRECYCNIKRLACIRRYLTAKSATVHGAAIMAS